ncbi:zinc-finger domain-containing protein [Rickettsia endosymbiont of Halotydeus destructor]|uniref:zinc-finger domain-containing protein n=1 Tax=Rickettsia endosymbiont of Halotydeus destructor TaxID=2996754 RepID=UPI003BB10A56
MEIVDSFFTSVTCAGKEVPFDHPKVYLEIDPKKQEISCPYCSKKFKLVKK